MVSALNVTANIAGGNITTPGLLLVTGNITGGNITTGGIISITSNTVSTSNITGALVITASGGLGVGGNIYATQIFDGGSRVLTVDSTVDGGTF